MSRISTYRRERLSAKFSRQRRLISTLTLFRPRRRVRVLFSPLLLRSGSGGGGAAATVTATASFSRVRSRYNYAMRSKNTVENVSGTAGIMFQGCCVRSKGSACSREPLTRALPPSHPSSLSMVAATTTTMSLLETALSVCVCDQTHFPRDISGLTFPIVIYINVVALTIFVFFLHARNDKQTS